jgi:hypothetical protein
MDSGPCVLTNPLSQPALRLRFEPATDCARYARLALQAWPAENPPPPRLTFVVMYDNV